MKYSAKAVVEKMFSAFGGGDIEKFVGTVSEDTVWIYHGTQIIPAGTFEKKEGVRTFFSNILDRTEIIHFEPQQYIVEGNMVVVLGREHQKVKRSGRELKQKWVQIYTVENDLITRMEEFTHRDSLGVEQIIRPGEVNWMTAGKGISHSERFEDPELLQKGGLEMLQTWVALPGSVEESDPTFENYKPNQLPVYTDKGIWMRLIAGNAYGLRNDVSVHSPMFYLHVKLEAGAQINLPTGHSERAIYITNGSLEISGITYSNGQMIVFSKNEEATVRAKTNAELMILGGEPLGERFIWWNFVSSSKERIEQAKNDWKTGKIILPPNDNKAFVPLPKTRSGPASSNVPPPEPLS